MALSPLATTFVDILAGLEKEGWRLIYSDGREILSNEIKEYSDHTSQRSE